MPAPVGTDPSQPPSSEAPVPSPKRRWWGPRRPWLPLSLVVLIAAAAILVAVPTTRETRDIRGETAATKERISELRVPFDQRAEEIERLRAGELEQVHIGQDCTLAAQTGLEVLNTYIRLLEAGARGEAEHARKELLAVARLSRQANRAARSCAEGIEPTDETPAEGEVV